MVFNDAPRRSSEIVGGRSENHGVRQRFRVAMIDVDLVQIHFAAYFQWMDRGLQEILSLPGAMTTGQMLATGFGTPMVAIQCTFSKPARLGDFIEVHSRIIRCGRSSFDVEHVFFNEQEELLDRAVTTQVYIELASQKPQPLPEWLRALQVPIISATEAKDNLKGVMTNE
jgi:YbgC/YbaW family acyl-CoA thioester hydrolase